MLGHRVADSQRYIQPHTEELQPELGLAESFVQQPTKVYWEYYPPCRHHIQVCLIFRLHQSRSIQ